MSVTSADVAKHAGVSRAAVSQILNGRGQRFAAATRDRVEQAARDLDYQPSAAGRALAMGSSDVIIALVPNTTFGGNLQELFESATDELAERGLTLVLRLATQSPTSLDRIVAGMRPKAVLSLQPFTDIERRVLADRGIPGFDTAPGGDLNAAIGRLQAEHLIARGYRKLAFAHLRDARDNPYGADREAGVREACHAAGLPDPVVVGLAVDAADATTALEEVGPGTGIAAYNDDVAIALLFAAGRLGWHVPADLGIVGMDHIPLTRATEPALTTVGYDLAVVAQNTVAAALTALGETAEGAFRDIRLRLIPGDTA